MDPIIISVLTALVGLAMRGIAIAELLMRLRWQERHQRGHRAHLTALARALPRGTARGRAAPRPARAARSAAVRLGQPDPGRAGRRQLGRRQG